MLFILSQTRTIVSTTWAVHTETTRLSWHCTVQLTVVVCHSAWLPIHLHILCEAGLEMHWEACCRLINCFCQLEIFLPVAWYHLTFSITLFNWPSYFFRGLCTFRYQDRTSIWRLDIDVVNNVDLSLYWVCLGQTPAVIGPSLERTQRGELRLHLDLEQSEIHT